MIENELRCPQCGRECTRIDGSDCCYGKDEDTGRPLMSAKEIGVIELGPRARITDPCYPDHAGCAVMREIRSGLYRAVVLEVDCDEWGIRVGALVIVHEEADEEVWELDADNAKVSVDSGCVGFFCSSLDQPTRAAVTDKWFVGPESAWKIWNMIPRGVASDSGFGDGRYPLFVVKNGEEIVGLAIAFVEEVESILTSSFEFV